MSTKVDQFITLADALVSEVKGKSIELHHRESDGKLLVNCCNEDFNAWFNGFEDICLFVNGDCYSAEVNYLGHLFVSTYVGDTDYEASYF